MRLLGRLRCRARAVRWSAASLLVLIALAAAACSASGVSTAGADTASSGSGLATTSVSQAADTATELASGAGSEGQATVAAGGPSDEHQDDHISIAVKKVTSGSGKDLVTYYVADIILDDATQLLSAFSSGEFGGREEETSEMALANDALVAINGDYYSARDDGIIIRNGVVYRDLPARTGLAIYKDGSMKVYDETEVSAEELLANGVWNTYSFGPALVDESDLVEGVDQYEADPEARHGIQGLNPRTGIGLVEPGHFVFVVVDGRDAGYSRGVTLSEFAAIFQELGCTIAYNLDGGGSSTLYYQGEVVNQPSQERGERSVSDILFVG